MKRLIVLLVAAAVLAPVAASAGATANTTSARLDCTKLRAAIGATAFGQAYSSFGACVSRYAPVEQQVTVSAQATCTAQQADPNFATTHGGKTFAQYYGSGKKERNAFGNCVSTVAKANSKSEQQGRVNPARTCRSERTQLGTSTFNATYGKNSNDRNAFGKCVSATAKAQVQDEVSASSSCKSSQQTDPNFAQTYGTNADLTNAFGKCVSTTASAKSNAQEHAVVNAARTCKGAKKSDPSGFNAKYGSFGKCVSAQVSKSSQA